MRNLVEGNAISWFSLGYLLDFHGKPGRDNLPRQPGVLVSTRMLAGIFSKFSRAFFEGLRNLFFMVILCNILFWWQIASPMTCVSTLEALEAIKKLHL